MTFQMCLRLVTFIYKQKQINNVVRNVTRSGYMATTIFGILSQYDNTAISYTIRFLKFNAVAVTSTIYVCKPLHINPVV